MAKDIFGNDIIQQQKTDKFGNVVQSTNTLSSFSDSSFFGKETPELQTPSEKSDASLAQMGGALATEIAIAEGGRTASAVVGGPIGYVLGGLASGAVGSYVAQQMVDPENISVGRIIADSFINLIPGSKSKRGVELLQDAATRQAGYGAAISAGGMAAEIGIDEGRAPTMGRTSKCRFYWCFIRRWTRSYRCRIQQSL